MKDASLAIAGTIQATEKILSKAGWPIAAEPYSPLAKVSTGSDALRLRAALKRAVERDLAPQTLIDAIKDKIRNSDESR